MYSNVEWKKIDKIKANENFAFTQLLYKNENYYNFSQLFTLFSFFLLDFFFWNFD